MSEYTCILSKKYVHVYELKKT